jgi:murein DD-endopeptidase MepM/ murein hydrolase activator NlpD
LPGYRRRSAAKLEERGLTVSKARKRLPLLIASALIGVLMALPVRADTGDDLAAAKKRQAQVQAELNRATAAHQAAVTRYQSTLDEIAQTRAAIAATEKKLHRLRGGLAQRARDAYERGAAGTLDVLLTSSSFSQFSDRVQYLDRMSEGDADLIILANVTSEQLSRQRADLERLSKTQAAAAAEAAAQEATIASLFREAEALVDKLGEQLKAEQQLSNFVDVVQGAGLNACPVNGSRSYWNDYGQPRSGGRSHQGNDILAPYGTPVVAAQSGRFEATSNSLGGTSAFVYGDGGDLTYYAHLSAYAGVGSGSHVGAGQAIGAVGDSGNASGGPPHLHFEYHPGGGGPTNPYPYLQAVCG